MQADVLERLGIRLEDGYIYGWTEIYNFVKHLPLESATYRALYEEETTFSGSYGRAYLLADIYDAILNLNWTLAAANSKHKPRQPRPHPRPGDKAERYGRGAIPIKDFEQWYYGGE